MKPVRHDDGEPEIITRIVDLLIEKGKKQQELTDYLGLHCNNFTEWKAGRKRSYLLYIDEIAAFLDVSPTYLLRGSEEESLQYLLQESYLESAQAKNTLLERYKQEPNAVTVNVMTELVLSPIMFEDELKAAVGMFDRKGENFISYKDKGNFDTLCFDRLLQLLRIYAKRNPEGAREAATRMIAILERLDSDDEDFRFDIDCVKEIVE